jgi:hypothetical protein
MSKPPEQGGFVFPYDFENTPQLQWGTTLRDLVALTAAKAILSREQQCVSTQDVAVGAFMFADAFIRARTR